MMKIIKLSILFLLLLISCKKDVDNMAFINKLSSIQNDLPSPYFNYQLYFKVDNGQLLETNVDVIYELYKDKYSHKYISFRDFLIILFNNSKSIKMAEIKKYFGKSYFLNVDKIDNNIYEKNIEFLEKKYFKKKQGTLLLLTKNLNSSQIKTILFKMFLNGYVITLNDYTGYYSVRKYKELDFK